MDSSISEANCLYLSLLYMCIYVIYFLPYRTIQALDKKKQKQGNTIKIIIVSKMKHLRWVCSKEPSHRDIF